MRWLMMVTLVTGSVASAAPIEMAHSGRLLGATGAPLQGELSVELSLWDAQTGGTAPDWSDSFDVVLQDGFYSVVLGSDVVLDTEQHLAGPEVWLQVEAGGVTLGARQKLLSVPHAARASALDGGATVGGALVLGSEDSSWCTPADEGGLIYDAAIQGLRVCTATGWSVVGAIQIVWDGSTRRWSDGTMASACWEYRNPTGLYIYDGAVGSGTYRVDPLGNGTGFDVYCEMEFEGGGWTLIDNDPTASGTFNSRPVGALTSASQTGGRRLPGYAWSDDPLLLCRSSIYTGFADWLTLEAGGALAREYPTTVSRSDSHTAGWAPRALNGNANHGMTSWIYNGSGRFGSVWIGNGSDSTCSCNYTGDSSGVGIDGLSNASTCSTWVR